MRHKNRKECLDPAIIVNNYYSVFSFPRRKHDHDKKCDHIFWNYKVGMTTLKAEEATKMLELSCTNEEKIHVTLNPATAAGKPVKIESFAVEVQSGDGTFEVDPDGAFGFWIISGEAAGDTAYAVNADADLGEGVENIADFITLRVAGAKAAALGMAAETPVLK